MNGYEVATDSTRSDTPRPLEEARQFLTAQASLVSNE